MIAQTSRLGGGGGIISGFSVSGSTAGAKRKRQASATFAPFAGVGVHAGVVGGSGKLGDAELDTILSGPSNIRRSKKFKVPKLT